ncbi:hypothetical protein C9374_007158 [Naegleria lovaniensis]|uniref:Uncharacterized protein n=1 Tax=Naegleria lovaniensis TaxID=51637 RepID=A0AA88H735_NAELO|nr:uncharacterized protein C9374_007158 [Naegleria lovaniensis]KAG2393627.1 hypothetical protein C9374_007158 [Naegleria lovaniensis]
MQQLKDLLQSEFSSTTSSEQQSSNNQTGGSVPSTTIPLSVQDYLNQTAAKKEIGFMDLCLSDKQKLAQILRALDDSNQEASKYKQLYQDEMKKNEELTLKNQQQQDLFEKESNDLKTKYNTSAAKLKRLKEKSDEIIEKLAKEREREQQERASETNYLREENKRMLERIGNLQKDKLRLERLVEELEINRMSLILQKKEKKDASIQTEEPTKPEPIQTLTVATNTSNLILNTEPQPSPLLNKSIRDHASIQELNYRSSSPTSKKDKPPLPTVDVKRKKSKKTAASNPVPKEVEEYHEVMNRVRERRILSQNFVDASSSEEQRRSPLLNYLTTPKKNPITNKNIGSRRIDRTIDDSDLLNIVQKSEKAKKEESPHKSTANTMRHLLVFADTTSSSTDRLPEPAHPPPQPEKLPEREEKHYSFSESFISETSFTSDSDGEVYDEDSLMNVVKILEEQQNLVNRSLSSSTLSSSYQFTDTSMEGKSWFEK